VAESAQCYKQMSFQCLLEDSIRLELLSVMYTYSCIS